MRLKQGDVVWADMPHPAGTRPVVVLTRSPAIGFLHSITIAPITGTIRGIDTEVLLSTADGLREDCVVTLDNVTTIR